MKILLLWPMFYVQFSLSLMTAAIPHSPRLTKAPEVQPAESQPTAVVFDFYTGKRLNVG